MPVLVRPGDCLDVMRTMPDASVHAIVTDPPYSLTDRREQYCASDMLRDAIVMDAQHGDAKIREGSVTFRISVSRSLASMLVGGINLDAHPASGQVEVQDDRLPVREGDDVLVDERDAVAREQCLSGDFRLWVRQGSARCIGACRCLGKGSDGRLRVPVRLRHDAARQAQRTAGVVAGAGAEDAAVLALDVAGRTGELLPASGADAIDAPFELLCPEVVGAATRAGGLPTVAETGGVGGVGDMADGTFAFDLLAHRAVLSWRPISLRGFMSKQWDGTGIETDVRLWKECLRVLKPGGFLLAFGGTRTFHRLACAVEDGGFEIRDSIAWLYGSGFPKSLDVGKAIDKAGGNPLAFRRFARAYAAAVDASLMTHTDIDRHLGVKSSSCYWAREDHRGGMPPRHHWDAVRDLLGLSVDFKRLYDEAEREVLGERRRPATGREGYGFGEDFTDTAPATPAAREWAGWGTALKPSREDVVVARKPLAGSVAGNVQEWGTGALNIGACRVAGDVPTTTRGRNQFGVINDDGWQPSQTGDRVEPHAAGRWPANVVLDGTRFPVARLKYNVPRDIERVIREYFGASTHHLPAVRDHAGDSSEPGGPQEVLLPSVLRGMDGGEHDGREGHPLRDGTFRGDPAEDLRDAEDSGDLGAEGVELEGWPSCERRLRDDQREQPRLARARPVRLDGVVAVDPGASVSDGPAAGSSAAVRRAGAPRQRGSDGQPAGEPGTAQPGDAQPGARKDRGGDPQVAAGERGFASRPLEVLVCNVPDGWRQYFELTGAEVGSQADALDQQSGMLTSGNLNAGHKRGRGTSSYDGGGGIIQRDYGGDSGGASRFFPTFRYQAKAPTTERPSYYRPSCNCETMKPCNEGTSPPRDIAESSSGDGKSWSTSTSGNSTTDEPCLPGMTSTTATATSSTTTSRTSSSSRNSNTSASTRDASYATASGGSPAGSAGSSSPSTSPTGTSAPKAGPSTGGAAPVTSPRWSATSVCENCGAPTQRVAHSTVKPLGLMRWLVRLVTPPGGVVLDPFAGSGATVEACIIEGFDCIAIERDPESLPLIQIRIDRQAGTLPFEDVS
jgi:DNA modification methylase